MLVIDAPSGERLAWAAFACNLGLHFSQMPLMRTMLADADPNSLAMYSALPSLLQASACSMWLAYAVCVLDSPALLANNIIGVIVSAVYAAVFVFKRPTARGKAVVGGAWCLAIAATLLIYGCLYYAPPLSPDREVVASVLTVGITLFLWVSPLVALRTAARELDDKRVPVPLTALMFATVLVWLAVGVLVGDASLVVSSVVGLAATLTQFAALCWIRRAIRRRALAAACSVDDGATKAAPDGAASGGVETPTA